MEVLSKTELLSLVQRVFQPTSDDHSLAVLIDLPDAVVLDTPKWQQRRQLAADWVRHLKSGQSELGLTTDLIAYPNVGTNNGELPQQAWIWEKPKSPDQSKDLEDGSPVAFEKIYEKYSILMALTQFSATAPLKVAAGTYGIRAATLPGFIPEMIPALRLDYQEINRRVLLLKDLLDQAQGAHFEFLVDREKLLELDLDLRGRSAHASGGLIPKPGTAGNLPSGECYIVPYEGERPGDPSESNGFLPVQFEQEVVTYHIEKNRAVGVSQGGKWADFEQEKLTTEPAYGNLAELGLGVLADFGVKPVGEILLDEKLGLHIAFGRSDHFGGAVGPKDFSNPKNVVHIDRVYLPSLQPRISVRSAYLKMPDQRLKNLISNDRYVVSF